MPREAAPIGAYRAPFARLALASPARQSSLERRSTVPKYLVTATQTIYYGRQSAWIEVEAESEATAKEEAKRKYADGEVFFDVDDVQDVGEPRFEIFETLGMEPAQ
jgi:hypothetical protein